MYKLISIGLCVSRERPGDEGFFQAPVQMISWDFDSDPRYSSFSEEYQTARPPAVLHQKGEVAWRPGPLWPACLLCLAPSCTVELFPSCIAHFDVFSGVVGAYSGSCHGGIASWVDPPDRWSTSTTWSGTTARHILCKRLDVRPVGCLERNTRNRELTMGAYACLGYRCSSPPTTASTSSSTTASPSTPSATPWLVALPHTCEIYFSQTM
jgi:hypothetical protein